MARSKRRYIGMDIMPDGRIRKRFTVEGKRYAVYGVSPKDVEEAAAKKRIEIENKAYKRNEVITFQDYFKEWIARKAGTVSDATIFNYGHIFKKHIKGTELARRKIQKIERREIVELHGKIAKEKTAGTANRVLLVIHAVLRTAVMDEIIIRNPCTGIPRLQEGTTPARETIHRALTKEEIAAFMKAAKGTWYYNAYRFMLATGVRVGECGALEWGDVDYKKNVIHIRRTITKNKKGEWIVGHSTKTKTSRRDIPINAEIRGILQDQRALYNNFHGQRIEGLHTRMFESVGGNFIRATPINNAIQYIAKRAGVVYFTVHAFRDTFATSAIMQGMNPNTLKEIMGHATITMTMDLYAHVLEEEKRKAMDGLQVIAMRG